MLVDQEPEAAPVTGVETAQDIKTDYSRATSRTITTHLNRDFAIIKRLLQGGGAGGGSTGPGRYVGRDMEEGRVTGAEPDDLLLTVPNATYNMAGELVEVDGPGGFVTVPTPPNMAGRFGWLIPVEGGGISIAWGDATLDGHPPEEADLYPVVGRVTTDATKVVSIDYDYADEIATPAQLHIRLRQIQAQIDALQTPDENGETPGGIVSRGDLIPWDATDVERSIKDATLTLIDDLRAELIDRMDTGRSKPMQSDNDHFVEAMMRIYAATARVTPEVTDLVEAAMVLVGHAGHSRSGDFEEPGINGTTNHLRYTTMQINHHARGMTP